MELMDSGDRRMSAYERLCRSFMNHQKEAEVIKGKIKNPDVPAEKIPRLQRRQVQVETVIMPRIVDAMRRCVC